MAKRKTDVLSVYLASKYSGRLPKSLYDHSDISDKFKLWFHFERQLCEPSKAWRVLDNNSGMAHHRDGTVIPYGMPPTGGGADKFAFGPGGVTEFYEIKTFKYSKMSDKQIRFADMVSSLGFRYFIVMEDPQDGRGFEIISYSTS